MSVLFTRRGEPPVLPPPTPPSKGDLITMDLGNSVPDLGINNVYRVLSISDNIASVMAMFGMYPQQFASLERSSYNGSLLDTYFNTTWYSSLSSDAKSAIISTDICQYNYTYSKSVYDKDNHASYADYSTKSLVEKIYNRYVYAIDVEDIETYFNGTFGKFDMFEFGWHSIPIEYTYNIDWLRSAYGSTMVYGMDYDANTPTYRIHYRAANLTATARPAFRIDLSLIDWDYYTE